MKKTILVTGNTDGIGKLVALKLAKDGYEIYLHGRNADKEVDGYGLKSNNSLSTISI